MQNRPASRRSKARHYVRTSLTAIALASGAQGAFAADAPARVDQCSAGGFCYCVNSALLVPIADKVKYIREQVRQQRALGKATGYMSVPLSTIAGSYYGVNADVAADVKTAVELRLGAAEAWILNPSAKDVALPNGAIGADYMWMWTQVFEGDDGLGRDFDFIYFVGPKAFAERLKLTGVGDFATLDKYYDDTLASKADKPDKKAFREYYGLRAAVSYSLGSHDEWNIARSINQRRRTTPAYGIAGQLAVLFDGQAVAPGLFEAGVVGGDSTNCPK